MNDLNVLTFKREPPLQDFAALTRRQIELEKVVLGTCLLFVKKSSSDEISWEIV